MSSSYRDGLKGPISNQTGSSCQITSCELPFHRQSWTLGCCLTERYIPIILRLGLLLMASVKLNQELYSELANPQQQFILTALFRSGKAVWLFTLYVGCCSWFQLRMRSATSPPGSTHHQASLPHKKSRPTSITLRCYWISSWILTERVGSKLTLLQHHHMPKGRSSLPLTQEKCWSLKLDNVCQSHIHWRITAALKFEETL